VSVTGLERVLTLRADARLGEQILEDLTVSDVGDDDNACERNMPAAIIVSPSTSSLTMSRIRLDRLERRGIVISGSGATVNVEDVDGHDVKCKFLEAAGGAQVRARRLAATRTALAETGVIRNDDLLTTTGTSSLLVTDARFELSTARSLLRSTKGGRFRLERWHATAADALLYVDDLTPSTPDDAEPQAIRDGKIVSVRRAAVPSVGSCARLRAARLFVRVSVPPDTDFWSTCR
jgi:hypothetical protein